MRSDVDYDTLNDALRRCGATWDAAQAHGLLSSRLAVAGTDAGLDWLQQVLEGTHESDALRAECAAMLDTLFQATQRQLSERLSEFAPLLPDDSDTASVRAAALAHWCEGFLHGLVSVDHGETLKERLARDPLADIIKDMLQLTRADVDEDIERSGLRGNCRVCACRGAADLRGACRPPQPAGRIAGRSRRDPALSPRPRLE